MKRKENYLLISAKLHAPIKNTDPEHIKLTIQNIQLVNKALESEIEQMRLKLKINALTLKITTSIMTLLLLCRILIKVRCHIS